MSTALLVNKFTISFLQSDVDEPGTNGKPVPCPTELNLSHVIQARQ